MQNCAIMKYYTEHFTRFLHVMIACNVMSCYTLLCPVILCYVMRSEFHHSTAHASTVECRSHPSRVALY